MNLEKFEWNESMISDESLLKSLFNGNWFYYTAALFLGAYTHS